MQRYDIIHSVKNGLGVSNFPQALQGAVLQAKKMGKTVYLFSVDSDGGKVMHVNYVSEPLRKRGLDARQWATKVAEVIGGKVGYVRTLYENPLILHISGWRER
jgi:alanyl-tRNA synthetase